MKSYCVGFFFTPDLHKVLLLKRNKEPYKGLLNGVGGKLEQGENTLQAMRREFMEETGLEYIGPLNSIVSMLFPTEIILHCFAFKMPFARFPFDYHEVNGKRVEEGILQWHRVSEIQNVLDSRLAGDGNLPYLIHEGRRLMELGTSSII